MSDLDDGLTTAQKQAQLSEQIQGLIDRAPQDGKTPIALRAIAPALIALAQQLDRLRYYVLQSRDGNWLLTTLQNNSDSTLEKAVVYGFPSIEDARSSLKSPAKPDLVAVAMPIAQILFQLLAFDRIDSAIFFDRVGSRDRGIEIQRSELKQLANAHLQKCWLKTARLSGNLRRDRAIFPQIWPSVSRTYRATGINLKSSLLGESDRILTVLTRDHGLIRAVAAGSRKPKSSLGGRCGLFVVNKLLLAKGKSLDRLTQAEAIATYAGLSKDLGRLTASQYLAELVLLQTPDSPDPHLFDLILALLDRLEALPDQASPTMTLATLCVGIFKLLDFGGLAPQVHQCGVTGTAIEPEITDPSWRVGFNFQVGGAINLSLCRQLQQQREPEIRQLWHSDRDAALALRVPTPDRYLNATDLALLQHLAHGHSFDRHFEQLTLPHLATAWINVENLLRHYAQYHLGKGIASATLLDSYTTATLAIPPL